MLREITGTREGGTRRWFSDDYFDLIVWYDRKGRAVGFQLCYDKKGDERAVTWREGKQPTHERIETGEQSPLKNRTPILVPDGMVPYDELMNRFQERAATIEKTIFELVMQKLEQGRLKQ